MPRTELFAVRSALDLTDKQSHRLFAFAALDEIVGRKRPRAVWSHPALARQLGLSLHFVALMQNYLLYRAARGLNNDECLSLVGDNKVQITRVEDGRPLDQIRMVASARREAQMGALLGLALGLKTRVDGEFVVEIERFLGRACGLAWENLTAVYQRQCTAQKELIGA
ncbi:hypothetical protein ACH4S8_37855 [Streptomyces sp. NPDC021080]|uniref:hypothetical protein n=1 Tax=Streptomyces sp. NPDC021080 TaxID=3365110 RepID=UPI0037A84307